MGNIFNQDFRDFIIALNNHQVDYMLVGGYSVILHGYSRNTGDMDIWVKKSKENYHNIVSAFKEFGMPVFDMTEDNFMNSEKFDVFVFGVPPSSIDLITKIKGLEFDEAYTSVINKNFEGLQIKLIHLNDLIKAKKSSARPRDIDDIENLTL